MTLGDDGIIGKTEKSVNTYSDAETKETITLAMSEATYEYYIQRAEKPDLLTNAEPNTTDATKNIDGDVDGLMTTYLKRKFNQPNTKATAVIQYTTDDGIVEWEVETRRHP